MPDFLRRTLVPPSLALFSTLLWGLLELIALQGSRRRLRDK